LGSGEVELLDQPLIATAQALPVGTPQSEIGLPLATAT